MSCDFQLISLDQIGKIITGKTPPSKINDAFSSEINVPFITPKDMDGRRLMDFTERYLSEVGLESVQKNLIPAQAVCVSCIGSDMGKVVVSHYPSVTNQQINTIVVDQKRFDYRYIYYSLSTRQQELKDIAGGSATPILNKGHFGKVEISIPALRIQKKIADALDCLDLKIELNRQINQTLEEMAQAIFKSWFVDFEPVKAKMQALENGGTEDDANLAAMQAISGKTADQLATLKTTDPDQYQQLHHTASLFPSAMQDSELGEIPVGWKLQELGTIVEQRNERIKASSLTENSPYVPIDCISSKSLFLSNYKDGKDAKTSLIKVYKNDILFGAMRPYFHKVCVCPFDATTRTTAFVLKPIQPEDFSFAILQLFQPSTIEFATLHSEGSTIPYAKWQNSLEKMQITIPDEKIRYRFNSLVAPMLESITSKIFENDSLANLRDTILPKLLSGELQISTEDAA